MLKTISLSQAVAHGVVALCTGAKVRWHILFLQTLEK